MPPDVAPDQPAMVAATERWFVRRGVPHLIADYRASEDIFTRSLPVLGLVFLLELLGAANLEWGWLVNLAALAAAVADRVVVMSSGRTIATGTPQEVLTSQLISDVWGVEAELVQREGRSALHVEWLDRH